MPPKSLYHAMRGLNARMAANYRRGIGPTGVVLLLTTTGRKTGLPRQTPLQFEVVDGLITIASARGQEADSFKNILANPRVHVQVQKREFDAAAEPVTDPRRIADFLEMRLRRHPVMVRLIMHLFDGLPLRFPRARLEEDQPAKALVILHETGSCKSFPYNSGVTVDQKILLRSGAIAALLAVFVFRRNLGAELTLLHSIGLIPVPETPPVTTADWFTLLQTHPWVGITLLGAFDLVETILVGVFFLVPQRRILAYPPPRRPFCGCLQPVRNRHRFRFKPGLQSAHHQPAVRLNYKRDPSPCPPVRRGNPD